jgi:hypothetical protein
MDGPGLVVLKALAVVGLALILYRIRTPDTSLWASGMCVLLALLALSPRLLLQPTILSFLLFAATLLILFRAGVLASPRPDDADAYAPRALWLLPVLFVVWVNLDGWFVLGPITLLLCLLGQALQRLVRAPSAVPVGQLTAVFVVGTAACALNPFHVRAFTLPPELAFVFHRVLGPGMLPDAVFGGGKVLQTLQQRETLGTAPFSPVSWQYLANPDLGWNVAGLGFWVLLFLGLVSFAANSLLGPKDDPAAPPPLNATRFTLWLVFAVLALVQSRLIPFFAIVAGPITALTLGELAGWVTRPGEASGPPAWLPTAKLARLFGLVLLFALLALAWPGWLNTAPSFASTRHVAWEVPADPSLQKSAETLAGLKAAGQGDRVFNASLDSANYVVWFAPGVRVFLDYRYNLFPAVVDDYMTAKAAVVDHTKPAAEWSSVLAEHQVSHVLVPSPLRLPTPAAWWVHADRWAERYADSRAAVYSWSGPGRRWPRDLQRREWNALAFGAVPDEWKAPVHGPLPPAEGRGLWDRYVEGTPPSPRASRQVELLLAHYDLLVRNATQEAQRAMVATSGLPVAELAVTPGAGIAHGSLLANFVLASSYYNIQFPETRRTFFRPTDPPVPAVPLLLVRLARQAVAAQPTEEQNYLHLVNTYRVLYDFQEQFWTNYVSQNGSNLRDQLRRLQTVTALHTAVLLRPDDANLHRALAQMYDQQHYLDAALDQLQEALKLFETQRPVDRKRLEEWQAQKRSLEDYRADLEARVGPRQTDYDLKAATLKGLDKYRLAIHARYRYVDKQNREREEPNRGLVRQALKALNEIDPGTLTADERLEWQIAQLDLSLKLGQIRAVADVLPEMKESLGPLYPQFQVLVAGCLGRYDDLSAGLDAMEKQLVPQVTGTYVNLAVLALRNEAPDLVSAYARLGQFALGYPYADAVNRWSAAASQYFDLQVLRAACALEQGDTDAAARVHRRALRQAGGYTFHDRPMAERYLHFLDEQRRK